MRKYITKFQKALLLVTASAMIFTSNVVPAKAEVFNGSDGWNVYFDGNKMESTFKSSDIDDAVYKLQPGDTVNLELQLKNTYKDKTDWYMTNKVLKSLEDTQSVAEGGAYTYILKYISANGTETTLYSSDEVGGETINASGEGLHQATDSLAEYFYLDTLSSGQNGKITLQVKLEGETQGNAYQDTLAQLQMNFAVELSPDTPTDKPKSNPNMIFKTGDNTNSFKYIIIAVVAAVICAGAGGVMVYKNKKEDE